LERWRATLESIGIRLSRLKMEYLECEFKYSLTEDATSGEVTVGALAILQSLGLRNLRTWAQETIVQVKEDEGSTNEDIVHCIRVGWQFRGLSSRVLCDKKVPNKLKGKFYRMVVGLVLLHGSECWAVKNSQV